jgi:Rrf2 family protein
MIYSRSAEYALRALIQLATLAPDEYAMAKNIAAEGNIPGHFLAKILQDLARDGFLKSNKGPRGGFRLALPAEDLSMLRVIEAVDGAGRYDRCIGGAPECNDRAACGMHDSWKALRSRIIDYLGGTSIADLAEALGEKRRLLARPRRK